MDLIVYDLETYPNCFLAVFKCLNDDEYFVFEISDRKNQYNELVAFLTQQIESDDLLCGYNNHEFDAIVLYDVFYSAEKDAASLYTIAKQRATQIIEEDIELIGLQNRRSETDCLNTWSQVDIIKLYGGKGRLKQRAMELMNDQIIELPYDPANLLTDVEKDNLITYCKNDVKVADELLQLAVEMDHFTIRDTLAQIGILKPSRLRKAYRSADASLCDIIFRPPTQLTFNLNTLSTFRLCLDNNDLRDYVQRVARATTYEEFAAIRMTANFGKGVEVTLGEAGVHFSLDDFFKRKDDKTVIYDLDIKSQYPTTLTKYKLLKQPTLSQYDDILQRRFLYKKQGQRVFEQSMKLLLNGFSGKLKDRRSNLQDLEARAKMIVITQISLLQLAVNVNRIFSARIIAINTDGIVMTCDRSDVELLNRTIQHFENSWMYEVSVDEIDILYQANTNSYFKKKNDNWATAGQNGLRLPVRNVSDVLRNRYGTYLANYLIKHFDSNNQLSFRDWYNIQKDAGDFHQFVMIENGLRGEFRYNTTVTKNLRYCWVTEGAENWVKVTARNEGIVPNTHGWPIKSLTMLSDFDFETLDVEKYEQKCNEVLQSIRPRRRGIQF